MRRIDQRHLHPCFVLPSAAALLAAGPLLFAQGARLNVSIDQQKGSYSIAAPGIRGSVITGVPGVRVDDKWISGSSYPQHRVEQAQVTGPLGPAEEQTVIYSGLNGAPDLQLRIRSYNGEPFGEIQLTARNTTGAEEHIQSFRLLDVAGPEILHLGGDPTEDRVLSDSFSEDRPAMQIRDLGGAEKLLHRGVGAQLVYNRKSHQSWFLGALTSDKFLTVLRLRMAAEHSATTSSYEVDSTGTTELLEENSLQGSPAEDRVELSLPLAAGADLSSERMLFSISDDYHHQLETYGRLVRDLHHARVSAPTPLGWWSWTAYYFGLNQGTALTNAEWLAQNLKSFGYDFFHMDEGYQFARGEYSTPDAALFPGGMAALERNVISRGLVPGLWTAPFEVSERSWVFEHHPDWLVHNASGKPIHLDYVTDGKDRLYALDTTNPGAQSYLTQTYRTLTRDWGIRYIKMDFMEDSAVEGYYYLPNTTALEAERIGIETVRKAVGERVLLDKDGSELLNPVGLVDMGRISQDTGQTFSSSKDAAPGIAARYYMNRNYFIADPDAFTVSTQSADDQSWHSGRPLTLDEAKVSIALSAVSGGIFEIGDDLPTLGEDADRVALVKNHDLLDMARLGRASTPLDLMSYASEDLQPSIFLLHENPRQSVVTIFNWTEGSRSHTLSRAELGFSGSAKYTFADVLLPDTSSKSLGDALSITIPPHSVRILKVIRTDIAEAAPTVTTSVPPGGEAGETLQFVARPSSESNPVLEYRWDFGDGTSAAGAEVEHAYTHAGTYQVRIHTDGLSGSSGEQTNSLTIHGAVSTKFVPQAKRRSAAATQ